MIYGILLVVQVVVSIAIIALVLMQHGKGADAGAAFGSGASATVFGAQGSANFLSRATAFLATVFFVNGLALAYIAASEPEARSLMDQPTPEEAVEEDIPLSDVPGMDPEEAPADEPADTPGRPQDVPQ
ncbi:preprotein translocase subunit SecG [Thioalkalivibrio sp. ALJ24]|uniref:preprotein translocase subunit SecG n=1 Tax=Thioalkalivibrio sp. ALJ24 TaxID=545276 RepID=UPI0003825AF3|nr:preprotein translocase subunit SecG [Thioalkalivibrio sp. ALJ24]